jgi:phenylpyruvate tautomerase PptA (4-oxalocrotonate tautomerase family)
VEKSRILTVGNCEMVLQNLAAAYKKKIVATITERMAVQKQDFIESITKCVKDVTGAQMIITNIMAL